MLTASHDDLARRPRRLLFLAPFLLLSACGGGGGDDSFSAPPPAPVNPALSIGDASVLEGDSGNTTLQFTVTATVPSGSTAASASVDFATTADSATQGVDYVGTSGTLQFPSGTTEATIDVDVIGDFNIELDETLTVTLSSPVNATITQATATGTIRDDDSTTAVFGLDDRPDNLTCVAPARPTIDATVSVTDPYPSLPSLAVPTKILLEPGGSRWFVLQKSGQIVSFATNNPTSVTTYIDLTTTRSIRTDSEGGLLGMAFHPDYPATPEIFVSYTINHTGPAMRSVLSRMILDNVTSPGAGTTEQVILEVDQDFDNHNGGDIAFGPDGYLYFGLGDGGSGNDPLQRAQDTTRLLGSMLRIDVRGTGADYDIPPDNPFAAELKCGPGANANDCPEIYAWGLRNPWRWSFDEATGELWLADVGQGSFEEVNIVRRGGNYGWRCREGANDTSNASDCSGNESLIDPVTEYGRSDGNSVTGGYVYRGSAIPDLVGLYVFADFGSGRFWAARPDGTGSFDNDQLIDTSFRPTAFGIGPAGELYFVDIGGMGQGRVRRIDPAGSPTPDTIPDQLSDTGCVDPGDVTQPYAGLLPYDLNAPFWSDGAIKDRHIGLPNGTTIDVNADGDFDFPNGTVIVKNFRLGGALIETRHLMRHPDGVWAGYTYEWDAGQTEATRVRGGKTVNINGQDWIYPSEGQCMACHTSAAGFSLGAEIAQLNGDLTYPSTGRTANQLETIEHVMMFTSPLPGPANALDALADPTDGSASLDARARAYLHTNCAQCHRANGPTPSTMDLRYATALSDTNACDAMPLQGSLGLSNARLIAPGNANASLVVDRMQRRDIHGMPPIGSNVIDTSGVTLISDWINSLSNCD
ncbi:MAG: PQQ-dependent sugar dehydrogenase [Woeseiaceae bacterium]|nr:PQQ-dependent sugar dehydrogenase [Woeseiaceae bacterium]